MIEKGNILPHDFRLKDYFLTLYPQRLIILIILLFLLDNAINQTVDSQVELWTLSIIFNAPFVLALNIESHIPTTCAFNYRPCSSK